MIANNPTSTPLNPNWRPTTPGEFAGSCCYGSGLVLGATTSAFVDAAFNTVAMAAVFVATIAVGSVTCCFGCAPCREEMIRTRRSSRYDM